MSRAFVKEADGDQVSDDQPEWPISTHTNFVTAFGLEQLKQRRDDLQQQQNQLSQDKDALSNKISLIQIGRELRYVIARIASAKVISPASEGTDTVSIGATVTFIDDDEKRYQFTIVGEDEADIKLNKISWVSPLAHALLHQHLGDSVVWRRPVGDLHVEIEKIEYR